MTLVNAFSLNMIRESEALIRIKKVSLEEAREIIAEGFTSAVGHPDTAAILSDLLGMEVAPNRATITLQRGDKLLVAQYVGPRLPEGTTKLPEGAKIVFYLVEVE